MRDPRIHPAVGDSLLLNFKRFDVLGVDSRAVMTRFVTTYKSWPLSDFREQFKDAMVIERLDLPGKSEIPPSAT